MKSLRIAISLLFSFLIVQAACAAGLPTRHLISNVPPFDEITGLNCGPAAIESVFAYAGTDISQREIANVARTSSIGTYVYDIVRTGHFSALSAAQGRLFPPDVPLAGFSARGLGYAAFGHSQATPWLDQAKALVAQDIPVIMLMLFSPDPASGGHYRVLVGYDDTKGEAYFIDPWGRSLKHATNPDGTITWSYADLITAWNYPAYGSPQPYFGAVLLPWRVTLATAGRMAVGAQLTFTATAEYPCPAPFECRSVPARDSTLVLSLPPGLRLLRGSEETMLGNLPAGAKATARWTVLVEQPTSAPVTATASGLVSGYVPAAVWAGGQVYYPPYSYTDRIGGKASWTWPQPQP